MPLQLVSVYRNVCSGVVLYGVSATGEPKGSTVIVGLLLQWPVEDGANARVVVTTAAPPTAIATMAARPMAAGPARRRCLPDSRMLRSLHRQAPSRMAGANTNEGTPQLPKP